MNDTLEDLIQKAIDLKQGDKEFILTCYGGGDWMAGVGNPSSHVLLGESDPQFQARADSPRDAVLQLIEMLEWPGRHD